MILKPKNWHEHQHYKDRSPPWIKLHRKLLNDRDFMMLPIASKALAPLLWLLASESKDGAFNASEEELIFRLRVTAKDLQGLKPLIDKGFFVVASGALADCQQVATPETERETETQLEALSGKPDELEGFAQFWKVWPKTKRKQGKVKCLSIWKRKGFESQADAIVFHVMAMAKTDDWRRGFDPMPETYLNGQRWDGAELDAPESGVKPWFINGWNSIVTKGQEFRLNETDFNSPPEFRAAVLKAAGITPEMVKQAEAMAK